jgi:hypothetical protein
MFAILYRLNRPVGVAVQKTNHGEWRRQKRTSRKGAKSAKEDKKVKKAPQHLFLCALCAFA